MISSNLGRAVLARAYSDQWPPWRVGEIPKADRSAGRRLFRDRRLRGQMLPKPTGYRDAVPAGTSVTWKTHWNALRYRKRIDAGTRSKPSCFGGASPACIEVIQMTALSEAVGLHDGCRLSEAGYLGQVLTLTSALTAAGMGSTFQRTISFSTAGSPPEPRTSPRAGTRARPR
jgi:hypothetical protein